MVWIKIITILRLHVVQVKVTTSLNLTTFVVMATIITMGLRTWDDLGYSFCFFNSCLAVGNMTLTIENRNSVWQSPLLG